MGTDDASTRRGRTIADHGVRKLFGLMGDANVLYITDFIIRHEGRFVPAVDERNSVLMAGGYAAAVMWYELPPSPTAQP